jgi:hypothetical protein
MADRLRAILTDVAAGTPPPVDLETELLPRAPGPVSAVLAFTGHHVVAADVDQSWFDATRDLDDFGSVMRAPFLAALGEQVGARVGHFDLLMVAGPPGLGSSSSPLVELVELDPLREDHGRVRRALGFRREVRAYRTPDGDAVVMIGKGLADRWELAFEVEPVARGRGLGRALAAAAHSLVPAGEPLFAQVSPGNVASVRVLLAAGFAPVGSEVLLLHRNDHVY